MIHNFTAPSWNTSFSNKEQKQALTELENGKILYFSKLNFPLSASERSLISPEYADNHSKNISYDINSNKLWGVQNLTDSNHQQMKLLLRRFNHHASQLLQQLLPTYFKSISVGRCSLRPVEIGNRITSYRKDDKRLHIDAFPSAPNQGKRILRIFSNVNLNTDRVWRVGDTFENVATHFLPGLKKPVKGSRSILRMLRITKSYRSLYDHYMLGLHDAMKADDNYQQTAPQQTIKFSPNTSWIVQTDHVSHAAMTGQHVFEQTFYLPVSAMQNVECSPLHILEGLLGQPLT